MSESRKEENSRSFTGMPSSKILQVPNRCGDLFNLAQARTNSALNSELHGLKAPKSLIHSPKGQNSQAKWPINPFNDAAQQPNESRVKSFLNSDNTKDYSHPHKQTVKADIPRGYAPGLKVQKHEGFEDSYIKLRNTAFDYGITSVPMERGDFNSNAKNASLDFNLRSPDLSMQLKSGSPSHVAPNQNLSGHLTSASRSGVFQRFMSNHEHLLRTNQNQYAPPSLEPYSKSNLTLQSLAARDKPEPPRTAVVGKPEAQRSAQNALKEILTSKRMQNTLRPQFKLDQTAEQLKISSNNMNDSGVGGSSDIGSKSGTSPQPTQPGSSGHVSYTPLKNALASIAAYRKPDKQEQSSMTRANHKVLRKMHTQTPQNLTADYSFGDKNMSERSHDDINSANHRDMHDYSAEAPLQSSGRKVKRLVINVRMDGRSPKAPSRNQNGPNEFTPEATSKPYLKVGRLQQETPLGNQGSKSPNQEAKFHSQRSDGATEGVKVPKLLSEKLGSDLVHKLLSHKNSTPNSPKSNQMSKNMSQGSNLAVREDFLSPMMHKGMGMNTSKGLRVPKPGNEFGAVGGNTSEHMNSKLLKVLSQNYIRKEPSMSHNNTRLDLTGSKASKTTLQANFFKHKANLIDGLRAKLREASHSSRSPSRRPSAISGTSNIQPASSKQLHQDTISQDQDVPKKLGLPVHRGLDLNLIQQLKEPDFLSNTTRRLSKAACNPSYQQSGRDSGLGKQSPSLQSLKQGSGELKGTAPPESLNNLKGLAQLQTKDQSSVKLGTQISYLTPTQDKLADFVIPQLMEVASQEVLEELTISSSEQSRLLNSRVHDGLNSSILEAQAANSKLPGPEGSAGRNKPKLLRDPPKLSLVNSALLERSGVDNMKNFEISYRGSSSAVHSFHKSGGGDNAGQQSPADLSPGLRSNSKVQEGPLEMKNFAVVPIQSSYVSGQESESQVLQSTPQVKGTLANSQLLGLQSSQRSAYKRAQHGADYAVQEINKRGRRVYPQITALNLSACNVSNQPSDFEDSPPRDLASSDARWAGNPNSSRLQEDEATKGLARMGPSPSTKRSSRHKHGKSVDLEAGSLIRSTARGKRAGLHQPGLPNQDFQTVRKSLHNSEDCASVSMKRGIASGSPQGSQINYQLSKRHFDSIGNEEELDTLVVNDNNKVSRIEDEHTENQTQIEVEATLQKLLDPERTENSEARSHLIRNIKEFFEKQSEIFGQDYQTTLANYELLKCIGKGSFGKVYLGKQVLTDSQVAIKILHKKSLAVDSVEKAKVENEIVLLVMCNPLKNVISLLEVFETKDYYFLVFEHASEGDLISHLKSKGVMKEAQAKSVLSCIVAGLQDMHRMGIVHRDIKLDNVLCNSQGKYMLADLGISKKLNPSEMLRDKAGTPAYMAPEIIQGSSYRGFEADIWATGILLFALVYGRIPFKAEQLDQMQKKILNDEVVFPAKPETSSEFKDLIKRMLMKDPRKRASLSEIKCHPWLEEVWRTRETQVPTQASSQIDDICRELVSNFGFPSNYIQESISKDVLNHATACYLALKNTIGS